MACRILIIALAAGSLALASPARGADPGAPLLTPVRHESFLQGRAVHAAKAVLDSVVVIGPWTTTAAVNGQFESNYGAPDWNGWTSRDASVSDSLHWHADTYGALAGSYSAWCGADDLYDCGGADGVGYGDDWDDVIEWRGRVDDPGLPCTVDVSGLIAVDTEPGYDFAYVSVFKAGGIENLLWFDGNVAATTFTAQAVYEPGDYAGSGGDEVVVQLRFVSDGAVSDEDCQGPTDGAVRIDDIAIVLDNGAGYATDFEDGTLGALVIVPAVGVGDYAKIWSEPGTLETCVHPNPSPVVAFVDDGVVVPGTGGSTCLTWCYGPDGFVVNSYGGLAGEDRALFNFVMSPPVAWPGVAYAGALLEFDVWRHHLFTSNGSGPGLFYIWGVRSTTSADPADLAAEPWLDRNVVYEGGGEWYRHREVVGDLVPDDAAWVQVKLGVREIPEFGQIGHDATPAPYFDNVRLTAHEAPGPLLTAQIAGLPQDAFPAAGVLDLADLGRNMVRFDGAADAQQPWGVPPAHVAGDSIRIRVQPQRTDAVMAGAPRIHWKLRRNALFDPYRTAGLPDEGSSEGWLAESNGIPDTLGYYNFDLPDSGFLFPGDVLHVFFAATDIAGGVQETAILPADTTGFSDFDDPLAYPPEFRVRALPSLAADDAMPGELLQPSILFWQDGDNREGRPEWFLALANLGLVAGRDYDVYHTTAARSGVGNGLGGRASLAQIAGYDDILYTSGRLTAFTINSGDLGDDSPDAPLLVSWLETGGRDLLLTGTSLASDLAVQNGASSTLLNDWMGVNAASRQIHDLVDGQRTPLIQVEAGSPVFPSVQQWLGMTECFPEPVGGAVISYVARHYYDAVETLPGAVSLARYTSPGGASDQYPYSAATLKVDALSGSRVVSLPYDLESIGTVESGWMVATRVRLLRDILGYFGRTTFLDPLPVPEAAVFGAMAHPNPFNLSTTIRWSLPAAAHVRVDVHDLRGRHVRTLHDGPAVSGPGEAHWDGRGPDGRVQAAGVYFYRVTAGADIHVGKIALVK